MPEEWSPLPIDKGLFANLEEDAVIGWQTAVENSFANELGGHTRFPGLRLFTDLGGVARVYLHEFDGDLIAGTSNGHVFRITRTGVATDVTELPVSGGRRMVFAQTDRELLMAAGGPIVRLRNRVTELLSDNAPLAAFVGWMDNFTLAVEINSGRLFHSNVGAPDIWDPLDTFSADGNPDNINSMIITPFREILLGGQNSVEQFERNQAGGDPPFFRRWSIGDGVKLPYCLLFADNAMWTINLLSEWVRFAGQSSTTVSNEIGLLLEKIDDWTDAWMGGYPDSPLNAVGQKFMLLQAPHATNPYGTKGVTLIYDYRGQKFFALYGFRNGLPSRWPGWSHWRLWDRTFVGGEGKIYELTDESYLNGEEAQRWMVRTSHMATTSPEVWIKDFRLRVVRGSGGNTSAPNIRVRCSRDGKAFGPWVNRSLGKAGTRTQFIEFGGFGIAGTFQWEISATDDCKISLVKAEIKPEPVGH